MKSKRKPTSRLSTSFRPNPVSCPRLMPAPCVSDRWCWRRWWWASVIFFDPIFQGFTISLMVREVASLLFWRMTVPILYFLDIRWEVAHRNHPPPQKHETTHPELQINNTPGLWPYGPSFWWSRGQKHFMPIWDMSAGAPSGWPGSSWYFRRWL